MLHTMVECKITTSPDAEFDHSRSNDMGKGSQKLDSARAMPLWDGEWLTL